MTISVKHAFQSAKADGADASLVRPSNWNAEHNITLAASRLLGRATASAGAAEEISLGTGLSFAGTVLNFSTTAQLGYTPVNKAGDVMTGNLGISNSAPLIEMVDTTASAYSGQISINSNNMYFQGAPDAATYVTMVTFEMDTMVQRFGGVQAILNGTSAEMLRLEMASATTDPYISYFQAGVRKAYIQYLDGTAVNQGLRFYNDVATGGDTSLCLLNSGGVDSLEWQVNGTEYKVLHTGNIDTYDIAKYSVSTNVDEVSFPLGQILAVNSSVGCNRRATLSICLHTTAQWYTNTGHANSGTAISGTWRSIGRTEGDNAYYLLQRTA